MIWRCFEQIFICFSHAFGLLCILALIADTEQLTLGEQLHRLMQNGEVWRDNTK